MDSNTKENSIADKQNLAWSQEIPNYGNKLLKRLDDFRKTTILYDLRVRAEGGEFNAHKVILAACGGIFRTCFVDEKKKMISSEMTELSLDCPAQGLKPIIRLAYTGALVVTKRNAVATMIAAEVTKMKEVQEICADIAVKEYGWMIHFVGEKDATTIENLGKVLQMHAACFTASCSNGSHHDTDSEDDLPFAEEVDKEFPDRITTYRRLAIKLKSAETFITTTKLKAKQSAEQKPESTEPAEDVATIKVEDEPVTAEEDSLKAPEPANSKPPVPNGRSLKPDFEVVADDDRTNPFAPVPEEKTPKKSVTSLSPAVKAPESANPEPLLPLSAGHKKSKSDEVDDVNVAADDDETNPFAPVPEKKTPKKPVMSLSPAVKAPESANPEPLLPLSAGHKKSKSDEVDDVNVVDDDDETNPFAPVPKEKIAKKPVTSQSPVVKAPESANPEPLLPLSVGHKKSKSDDVDDVNFADDDDETNPFAPLPKKKTPKKSMAPPSPEVKARESANPKPPRSPCGTHKNSKPEESEAVESKDTNVAPIFNDQPPKKRSSPPTPKSKPPEPLTPKSPIPNGTARSAEKDGLKISLTNDENKPADPASTERTPKRQAPPSPRVKPRKSKKSAPAPPPPSAADQSPNAATPPRSTKAPAKVPPPRPRPPAAKRNSHSSEQGGSPTREEAEDDYDDSLNPFA